MALLNNGGASYVPPDLLKDASTPSLNENYFDILITDLDVDTPYALQFAWVFDDKTVSPYSASLNVRSAYEAQGLAPNFEGGDLIGLPGIIKINWDGKDSAFNPITAFDRIEYYITDAHDTFGNGTTPAGFFKAPGTISVAAPAGTYAVWLVRVSPTGAKSAKSNSHTITITAGITIEAPTLPTGLSATATPFAIQVDWVGSYSTKSFSGFQSIDIYASTTDLGSTTTSGLSASNLVSSLTVNETRNRINIGLENLRQAAGVTGATVYSTAFYLYYIATNLNGVKYSVGGNPTYTRINSSPISPQQANLIDLADGLISIENLVAGNGQFSSWLRAGSPGGARIELSGSETSFLNNGYNVLPGLAVYTSGNTAAFRADLSGNVTFGGYTPSDLTSISQNATAGAGAATNANTALQKTTNLNTSGNIIGPIQIPNGSGSLYSSKSSYGDSTAGWYLGWAGGNPVIDIGTGSNYVRWDGSALHVKGTIEGSTVTGSEVVLTGTPSTKITYQNPNYVIYGDYDSWSYPTSSDSYDPTTGETVTTTSTISKISRKIKITDKDFMGQIPTYNYYYGEAWFASGSDWGQASLYANWNNNFIGLDVRASSTDTGVYIRGGTGSSWTNQHLGVNGQEVAATLNIDSSGKLSRGRAIFYTASGSSTVTGSGWYSVGQNGDLAFSINN